MLPSEKRIAMHYNLSLHLAGESKEQIKQNLLWVAKHIGQEDPQAASALEGQMVVANWSEDFNGSRTGHSKSGQTSSLKKK
jgi:hypothetical protein